MQIVIAAGLCKGCTSMQTIQWNSCEPTTNHVEQMHEASYQASGRYSTLVKVIRA